MKQADYHAMLLIDYELGDPQTQMDRHSDAKQRAQFLRVFLKRNSVAGISVRTGTAARCGNHVDISFNDEQEHDRKKWPHHHNDECCRPNVQNSTYNHAVADNHTARTNAQHAG